jgi:hypothetical protein
LVNASDRLLHELSLQRIPRHAGVITGPYRRR